MIYLVISLINYKKRFIRESIEKSNEIMQSKELVAMVENFIVSYRSLCSSKDRFVVFEKILSEDNILCQEVLWSYHNRATKEEVNMSMTIKVDPMSRIL